MYHAWRMDLKENHQPFIQPKYNWKLNFQMKKNKQITSDSTTLFIAETWE